MKDIESLAGKGQSGPFRVFLKKEEIPVKDFYCEGHDNKLFALVNSSGYIEFFVCAGHAASGYQISIGDEVEIGLSDKTA
jgi:S-adenosylmethionine hydrolase